MKNTNPTPSLEEMLATVEHAGRDARRQQQLSKMIAGMAEQESTVRRHVVRLWATRVAAAACLLGIIFTIVRYMNLPVATTAPMLAEWQPKVSNHRPTGVIPAPKPAGKAHRTYKKQTLREETPTKLEARPLMDTPEKLPIFTEEDGLIELTEEPVLDPVFLGDLYADSEDPTAAAADDLAQATPAPDPVKKPRRQSLFRIRLAEPDLMEDNTLSFRLI